jgi:hypothetical protein
MNLDTRGATDTASTLARTSAASVISGAFAPAPPLARLFIRRANGGLSICFCYCYLFLR